MTRKIKIAALTISLICISIITQGAIKTMAYPVVTVDARTLYGNYLVSADVPFKIDNNITIFTATTQAGAVKSTSFEAFNAYVDINTSIKVYSATPAQVAYCKSPADAKQFITITVSTKNNQLTCEVTI